MTDKKDTLIFTTTDPGDDAPSIQLGSYTSCVDSIVSEDNRVRIDMSKLEEQVQKVHTEIRTSLNLPQPTHILTCFRLNAEGYLFHKLTVVYTTDALEVLEKLNITLSPTLLEKWKRAAFTVVTAQHDPPDTN